MPRNRTALDKPRPLKIRRHKIVLVFESLRNAKSFKQSFKETWSKHDTAFPGTLTFMSHEMDPVPVQKLD